MLQYLLLAFFAAASAEVFYDGPCPEVKPMENFNITACQGTWYEISRYPNAFQKGECSIAEYTISGDKIKINTSQVIDGVKSYLEADITLVGPAEIGFTFTFGGVTKSNNIHILDTDYNNYAISYSCRYFQDTNKHQVISWVKSRSKSLEGAVKETVENYLKNSDIVDSSKFVKDDQSEAACSGTN